MNSYVLYEPPTLRRARRPVGVLARAPPTPVPAARAMQYLTMHRVAALFILALPHSRIHAYDGGPGNVDVLSPETQIHLNKFLQGKESEGTAALKGAIGDHPDLVGETQKFGTAAENFIARALSKNEHWANIGART